MPLFGKKPLLSSLGTPPLTFPGRGPPPPPLAVGVQDVVLDFPELGSGMSVPVGITTFQTAVAMKVRVLSVDVPANVSLRIERDGALWFFSPGNEQGDREFLEPASQPVVRGGLRVQFNNTSAGDARVRCAVIGRPLVGGE